MKHPRCKPRDLCNRVVVDRGVVWSLLLLWWGSWTETRETEYLQVVQVPGTFVFSFRERNQPHHNIRSSTFLDRAGLDCNTGCSGTLEA